ncbi:RluA family pseudouridine synthase [Lacunimicrobium album]
MGRPYCVTFCVEPYLSGGRVDSFLSKHLRNYTDWRIARMVSAGAARIRGEQIPLTRRVFTGEEVTIDLIEPPDKLLEPEAFPLRIVFEDAWLLVIDKQPGVIAHPTGAMQNGTLCNFVQNYLDETGPIKGLIRPGIVHRLDRQTSGLIVLAKEHLAHRELSVAFQAHRISKTYLAIVEGVMKSDEGSIDLPIGRDNWKGHVLMSTRANTVDRKPAKTRYQVIERYPKHTLVAATPMTGRNHQIRVHLSSIGHPLVADAFYDAFGKFKSLDWPGDPLLKEFETFFPHDRHALHAAKLAFGHPITGTWMEFEAGLPGDLLAVRELLKRGN